MNKIEMIINRTNGETETVDVTTKFPGGMTAGMVEQLRSATKAAGRGNVVKAVMTTARHNIDILRAEWININNQGGDGFVPSDEQFAKSPKYREWVQVDEIK